MKNKKLKFIIVGVILLLTITLGVFLLLNNNTKIVEDNLTLNKEYSVEINTELTNKDLFNKLIENNCELISDDENIDTSSLGDKEITLKYKENNKEKTLAIKLTIEDKTSPVLSFTKELSTIEGTEIDLLKDVKVEDNSKEELEIKIEGEYDFNKVGTYNLKYIAEDSSKNKTEEEFTLTVTEKPKQVVKEQPKNNNQTRQNNTNNSNNQNVSSGWDAQQCSDSIWLSTYYSSREDVQAYLNNISNSHPECSYHKTYIAEGMFAYINGKLYIVTELDAEGHISKTSAKPVENQVTLDAASKYYGNYNNPDNYHKVFYLYHLSESLY